MMHLINDNEGEEKLSQLISAAREEKLLVSVDEVAKNLSTSASLHPPVKAIKPAFTIVHKAIIVLLASMIAALTVYYSREIKQDPALTATGKTVRQKSLPPSQAVKIEYPVEKESSSITKKHAENAVPESKKSNSPKEIFHFDGQATVVFNYKDKHVKMIADDKIRSLNIDNIDINESDFDRYEALIQYGLDIKKEQDQKRKTEEISNLANSKIIMQALLDKLTELNLIKEGEAFDFYLKGTSALLNAKELSTDQFLTLKNTYEETAGKPLSAKANIHVKH